MAKSTNTQNKKCNLKIKVILTITQIFLKFQVSNFSQVH